MSEDWHKEIFEGGRPPKLDGKQREHLTELLKEDESWKKQGIRHLLNTEFDVEFHPDYLPRFLSDFGLSYAITRFRVQRGQTDQITLMNRRFDPC